MSSKDPQIRIKQNRIEEKIAVSFFSHKASPVNYTFEFIINDNWDNSRINQHEDDDSWNNQLHVHAFFRELY